MRNVSMMRRLALAGATAAIVTMGTLTAGCSSTKEEPTTTTTPSSTTSVPSTTSTAPPTVSGTEKALSPGDNNSFSPTVKAPHPGGNCTSIVNGVCIR